MNYLCGLRGPCTSGDNARHSRRADNDATHGGGLPPLQPHQDARMLVFVMELSATGAASDIAPVAINHAAVNQIGMSL